MTKKTKKIERRTTSAAGISSTRGESGSGDFNPDYRYVRSDLRRIGLLAGSFLALLVILSFLVK
ncbi:MAG TPA: hypothetical protein VJ160_08225 [Anaerolineales bacterium]|nr:hypothetical protein [Anaerolineales bacterium]